jgi:hypothetical protein
MGMDNADDKAGKHGDRGRNNAREHKRDHDKN